MKPLGSLLKGKATTAILIKAGADTPHRVIEGYENYLPDKLFDEMVVVGLPYLSNGKTTAQFRKDALETILEDLKAAGVTTLYVADGDYFKSITGVKKTTEYLGVVTNCTFPKHEYTFKVILGYNYQVLFYNPLLETSLKKSIDALVNHMQGTTKEKSYITVDYQIIDDLTPLLNVPLLSCDTETFNLKFYKAGIGSIGFGLSESIAYIYDCQYSTYRNIPVRDLSRDYELRQQIKHFLLNYKGKLVFHNASYDLKILLFWVFMEGRFDNCEGMLEGIECFLRMDIHDTKLMLYVLNNNAIENTLGLKPNIVDAYGHYSEDVSDILQLPADKYTQYLANDCGGTLWLYKQLLPRMDAENQWPIYNFLKRSVLLYLQAEVVGLPLDINRVHEAYEYCIAERDKSIQDIKKSKIMQAYAEHVATKEFDNQADRWKKKRMPYEWFLEQVDFNPASSTQVRDLLFNFIGLDPVDLTDSGLESCNNKTITTLLKTVSPDKEDVITILKSLARLSEVNIIINNFLTTFIEDSVLHEDGVWYVHGNNNVGGTKSGRLSSSDPNLQNQPAQGEFGKLIKSCVVAPYGWLFCGADFSSLEDRIDALLTKDTAKIKVYTDGFDGHCLRAYYYFKEEMPDIDGDDVNSINSIAEKYPIQRQNSKAPTFALTYLGTWLTLVKNCGFTPELAKQIEKAYHELYVESDQYKMARLIQASKDGYATLAFGLRIKCPILAKSGIDNKYMTAAAKAEMRTLGNAFGQSYGMLNNRAGIAFQDTTLASPYKYEIMPVQHIHDAQYFLIKNDTKVIHFINTELIKEMSWQELPEIAHDQVKLGAELDIFWPSWKEKITLKNNLTLDEINELSEC